MRGSVLLLVEDAPADEKLTLRAFSRANIMNEVVLARDGTQALDYLFANGRHSGRELGELPAVVLLDLKLPKIDGLEVLRRIRADDRTRRLPVVILTASREMEDLVRGQALGKNAYLRKPVHAAAFIEACRTLGLAWMLLSDRRPSESG